MDALGFFGGVLYGVRVTLTSSNQLKTVKYGEGVFRLSSKNETKQFTLSFIFPGMKSRGCTEASVQTSRASSNCVYSPREAEIASGFISGK